MSAILKFDFQKRKQLRFSEVNYLNYTKKTKFCMWQLQLIYSTPVMFSIAVDIV